jgi:hypothetical protein
MGCSITISFEPAKDNEIIFKKQIGLRGLSSLAAVIFYAGQRARLSAKTTRLACATPSSNTFWRFPLKLPSSGTLTS